MGHNEARRLVQLGLDHRREEKEREAQERRLEEYEREMISACNGNAVAAKTLRLVTENERITRDQMIAQRKAEREKLQLEWERDIAAQESVRRYLMGCLVMMLVTVWTPLPWWAAAATIFGTAVIEGAYVFRLYYPLKK